MELFALRCFVEIVRAGGFTRAAEGLGRSQGAVSARIRSLEEELGLSLFDRGAPGLALTEAGARLLPRAERLVAEAEDLGRAAAGVSEEPTGRVVVAAGLSVIEELLPRALGSLRAEHPGVRLRLLNRSGGAMLRSLLEGEAELGVGWLLGGRARLSAELLGAVGFVLVRKKPPRETRAPSLESLLAGPLLCFEEGIDLRGYLEERLGPLEPVLELPSARSLLAWAARGFGAAILPLPPGAPAPAGLEARSLAGRVPPLELQLYSRAGSPLSRAAGLVAAGIRNAARRAGRAAAAPAGTGPHLPASRDSSTSSRNSAR